MKNRKHYIVGNWKMHGDAQMARALADAVVVCTEKFGAAAEVVLCPPTTLIYEVAHQLTGFNVAIGGQDCHGEDSGAFTGDISAAMLRDAGCSYVIVGHSERRQYHGETNEDVAKKATAAFKTGMVPIICIGENAAERRTGDAEKVVSEQLAGSIPKAAAGHFILAYEPVWAIGSGHTPTVEDIRSMHAHIRSVVGGNPVVLYGGSVKAANSAEILTIEGVSGVLVGGASVKAEEFCKIIESTQSLGSTY